MRHTDVCVFARTRVLFYFFKNMFMRGGVPIHHSSSSVPIDHCTFFSLFHIR